MFKSIKSAAAGANVKTTAILLFSGAKSLPAGYKDLDQKLDGQLSKAIKRPEFSLAKGAITTVYSTDQKSRVLVVGLGSKDKFQNGTLRIAGSKIAKEAAKSELTKIHLEVAAGLGKVISADEASRALAEGMSLGNFSFQLSKALSTAAAKKLSAH